jgi:parallel beta-helix repeat protein
MVMKLFLIFFIATMAVASSANADMATYTCVRNFYVAVDGINASGRGTQAFPWATMQYANNNGGLTGGDCVHVKAGIYDVGKVNHHSVLLTKGGNKNTSTGLIAWIGDPNLATHLMSSSSSSQDIIEIEANYTVIDGFDINASGTVGDAIGGSGHHVEIIHNAIHDAGGAGIGLTFADYYSILGNVVYRNASTNPNHESGISIYEPHAISGFTPSLSDDTAQFHIMIKNNIVHDNMEGPAIEGDHTDGDGIILDDWLDTQNPPYSPYPYHGLVQSNLCYNNGGAGIVAYSSQNIKIANNTAYNNWQDTQNPGTWRGELTNSSSHDIKWINNIGIAIVGSGVLSNNTAVLEGVEPPASDANVTWTHNITFDGTVGDASANFGTPTASSEFANFLRNNMAGVDPMLAPPQPNPGSPAIGAGQATPVTPPVSLNGSPMANPPDVGAY